MTSHSSPSCNRLPINDVLTLVPPGGKAHPFQVKIAVEQRGSLTLKSLGRHGRFRKVRLDSKHNLKVVWVMDMMDDEVGNIMNSFVLITPEVNYILQAESHRSKIEWMQSLSIAISQSLKFIESYKPSNWNNLEDLQKWLLTRNVDYQYCTHTEYKGAQYTGHWTLGMPHNYGTMKWTNGNRYDGEFLYGKFGGMGTFMWFTHPKYRHYTGAWQDGTMEGHGEMLFADWSRYTGWWHMGVRHGHGRMEYRHLRSTYVGGWEQDKKCGYGVYDNQVSSERYLGMWKSDLHHGAGIQVARNKYQFSGDYINGERSHIPYLVSQVDCSHVGSATASFKDLVTVALENSTKQTAELSYNVTGSMRRKSRSIIQDQKWDALFKCTSALLEQMVSISHNDIASTNISTPKSATSMDSAVAMDFNDNCTPLPELWETCSDNGRPSDSLSQCEGAGKFDGSCTVCKIEGFKSVNHPFGLLLNHLTKCFVESYSGVAIHASLLPHSISEICSITSRIHQMVRKYSPSLITTDENTLLGKPKTHLSMLIKKNQSLRANSYREPLCMDSSWLYPILLPSIIPTLSALYLEHYVQDDFKINHVITTLGHHGDEELSGILEMRSVYEDWKNRGMPRETFSEYLKGATEIFKSFSDSLTPLNKLLCLQEVEKELDQLCGNLCQGKKRKITSILEDQILEDQVEELEMQASSVGLFTFVIVRSNTRYLYSEMQFIQDFSGSTLLIDDYGFILSKLKDCYYKLLDLEL